MCCRICVINHQHGTHHHTRCGAYEVTGISPQSKTVAQLLKGFVSNGTLYPPLKPTLREPMCGRDQLVCMGTYYKLRRREP
jgi:hypothetical protein